MVPQKMGSAVELWAGWVPIQLGDLVPLSSFSKEGSIGALIPITTSERVSLLRIPAHIHLSLSTILPSGPVISCLCCALHPRGQLGWPDLPSASHRKGFQHRHPASLPRLRASLLLSEQNASALTQRRGFGDAAPRFSPPSAASRPRGSAPPCSTCGTCDSHLPAPESSTPPPPLLFSANPRGLRLRPLQRCLRSALCCTHDAFTCLMPLMPYNTQKVTSYMTGEEIEVRTGFMGQVPSKWLCQDLKGHLAGSEAHFLSTGTHFLPQEACANPLQSLACPKMFQTREQPPRAILYAPHDHSQGAGRPRWVPQTGLGSAPQRNQEARSGAALGQALKSSPRSSEITGAGHKPRTLPSSSREPSVNAKSFTAADAFSSQKQRELARHQAWGGNLRFHLSPTRAAPTRADPGVSRAAGPQAPPPPLRAGERLPPPSPRALLTYHSSPSRRPAFSLRPTPSSAFPFPRAAGRARGGTRGLVPRCQVPGCAPPLPHGPNCGPAPRVALRDASPLAALPEAPRAMT
uniref:Uncharacterized protein n=1 Tax=Rangifer tarandus platyrhynchus TaxID=3082113 RepID=A0ACB0FHX5_RANTA|nr:unnamed protein product [Rangifer tarandus platyrhynchus]